MRNPYSLEKLMAGATLADWRGLIDFSHGRGGTTKLYDPAVASLAPLPMDVLWTVDWLVSSYSKKFAFCGSKPPDLNDLRNQLIDYSNQLKWSLSLAGDGSSTALFKKPKSYRPPPCPRVVDPDVENWLLAFRSRVLSTTRSQSRAGCHKSYDNTFPLFKLALRQLKLIPYILVPNDKESGYSLIKESLFSNVEISTLLSKSYRAIRECDISIPSMVKTLRSLANRIKVETKEPKIAYSIFSSCDAEARWIANLGFTVKTHKEQGNITLRNLHKAPVYALKGLSMWVSGLLKAHSVIQFSIIDSAELASQAHGVHVAQGAKMATVDIKEFYMSGTIEQLHHDCMQMYSGPFFSLVSESLFLLLDWQYVVPSASSTIFKVVEGSGMGLSHSPVVASLSFAYRVERHLDPSILLNTYGISQYSRYHDDIFVVRNDAAKFKMFFDWCKSVAHHFEFKCTAANAIEVQYLDLVVSIVNGFLCVAPRTDKPVTPLHDHSAHPGHTHTSWPRSIARRNLNILKYVPSVRQPGIINALIEKYELCNASPGTLSILSANLRRTLRSSPPRKTNESIKSSWIKIGMHPLLYRVVPKILKSLEPPSGFPVRPRLAWKGVLPSLSSYIQRSNAKKLTP